MESTYESHLHEGELVPSSSSSNVHDDANCHLDTAWDTSIQCWNLTLVKSRINLRWIRTSCHHPSKSSLDWILAGTDNLSLALIFIFTQVKLVIPIGLSRISPHLSWFPLAIYPLRLSNCLTHPQGVEGFLSPFTLPGIQGHPRSTNLLSLHASWLAHSALGWARNHWELVVSSQSPMWECNLTWSRRIKTNMSHQVLPCLLPSITWCGLSAPVFPIGPEFFLPVVAYTYTFIEGIIAHYKWKCFPLSNFPRKEKKRKDTFKNILLYWTTHILSPIQKLLFFFKHYFGSVVILLLALSSLKYQAKAIYIYIYI